MQSNQVILRCEAWDPVRKAMPGPRSTSRSSTPEPEEYKLNDALISHVCVYDNCRKKFTGSNYRFPWDFCFCFRGRVRTKHYQLCPYHFLVLTNVESFRNQSDSWGTGTGNLGDLAVTSLFWWHTFSLLSFRDLQPSCVFLGINNPVPQRPALGGTLGRQGRAPLLSRGVCTTYQCWDCFENLSLPLKTRLFGWVWLTYCTISLFRKTSANSHTSSTCQPAVGVGSRVNGPKSGFYDTKWHHISSRWKEALGAGWISRKVETKAENLFLRLQVKTSPDINRKRRPIWNRKTYLLCWCSP